MPTSRSAGILIVDDEAGIRAALRQQLAAEGHFVLEASQGTEALALVQMQEGGVELVLADVVMPQMNGTELAARLHEEYPDLPVILMSAYAPAGWTRVGTHESIVPVLMKPFTSDQLAELIQIALDLPGKRRRTSRPTAVL
jgi:two-component system, cell cycle sensor histidine kinase and response regulator CckA